MSPRGILCAHTMLRVVVLVRLPLLAGPLVAMCVRAQSVCGRGLLKARFTQSGLMSRESTGHTLHTSDRCHSTSEDK